MSEFMYRYHERVDAEWDPWEERHTGYREYHIYVDEFPIIRETPKGVWIDVSYGGDPEEFKRFVLNEAHRRYACRTKEEALESFIARKKAQIRILNGQLKTAEMALMLALKEQVEGDKN
jgi:hypothetical protein